MYQFFLKFIISSQYYIKTFQMATTIEYQHHSHSPCQVHTSSNHCTLPHGSIGAQDSPKSSHASSVDNLTSQSCGNLQPAAWWLFIKSAELTKDNLNTRGCPTCLRKQPQDKQTVKLLATTHTHGTY